MNQKAKPNPWVWTKLAESKMPVRKAGEKVPIGFLIEGNEEYFPRPEWIQKGYVKRKKDESMKLQVRGVVEEEDGNILWAEVLGVQPEFYGVYVQEEDGTYEWLGDFQNEIEANAYSEALAKRKEKQHEKN
ncbi:hypothetical protein ABNF65_24630 [Paenibacillus larvae]